MVPVILVIGVQGSGKSWICRQLTDLFTYVAHDRCWVHPSVPSPPKDAIDPAWGPPGSKNVHFETLFNESQLSTKPVISEVPFGESELKNRLERVGIIVIPVFVLESGDIIAARYARREGKPLPAGVLTRNGGLARRARDWGAFGGTSVEVLAHLRWVFAFTRKKGKKAGETPKDSAG
jgi:hypothetical protein